MNYHFFNVIELNYQLQLTGHCPSPLAQGILSPDPLLKACCPQTPCSRPAVPRPPAQGLLSPDPLLKAYCPQTPCSRPAVPRPLAYLIYLFVYLLPLLHRPSNSRHSLNVVFGLSLHIHGDKTVLYQCIERVKLLYTCRECLMA